MDSIPASNTDWTTYISTIKNKLLEPATSTTTAAAAAAAAPISEIDQSLRRNPLTISRSIDHTLLALDATDSQVDALCTEAREYGFATVCVRLNHVVRAVETLSKPPSVLANTTTTDDNNHNHNGDVDTGRVKVGIACVIGFHEGTSPTTSKAAEASTAIRLGATELDMVMNWPLLKDGEYMRVYEDVLAVRTATTPPPSSSSAGSSEGGRVLLKVILETSQLSHDEVIAGCILAYMAGADFVKTSTGFIKGAVGATVEHVRLMRTVVDYMGQVSGRTGNGRCKVKASGGVRSAEECVRMLEAGAERIGTSSGVKIMKEVMGERKQQEGEEEEGKSGNY